jgi:hypothetical protein
MSQQLTAAAVESPPVRKRAWQFGAPAITVAVAAALWAAYKPQQGGPDTGGLAYVIIATVIIGCLIFALLVPARLKAGGTGLPLAILSIPLIYAFWSGLPLITGTAAIALATAHRAPEAEHGGPAISAIVVASLTMAVCVIAVLSG